MACPLCASDKYRKSAFSCVYREIEFRYVEYLGCESLYCNPVPEPAMLQQMCGPRYAVAFSEARATTSKTQKTPTSALSGFGTGAREHSWITAVVLVCSSKLRPRLDGDR